MTPTAYDGVGRAYCLTCDTPLLDVDSPECRCATRTPGGHVSSHEARRGPLDRGTQPALLGRELRKVDVMDREMMEALRMDAEILEAMGAGEQPLAFKTHACGMRLTDSQRDLWEVYDTLGNILGRGLSMEEADKMLMESTP